MKVRFYCIGKEKIKIKKTTITFILLSWGIFLAGGAATAATTGINPASNLIADPGGILDTLYGLGNLQRVEDFDVLPNDQIWFNPSTGFAQAQAKFAAYGQEFGYIPDADGNGIFNEAVQPLFSIGGNINTILSSGPSGILSGGPVGFIWAIKTSDGHTWKSLSDLNGDGLDHMVTWVITSGEGAGNFVIAWEDVWGGFDLDYNDLVVEIDVAPVPIPPAFLLLGSGLVAMIGIRRKLKY